jgi:adenosylhomocysteinase
MANFKVKDSKLAQKGALQVEWAEMHMPVLHQIKQRFKREEPLRDVTLGACLHVTKETAVLMDTFAAGGAHMALCGSNPLSTQDDVAAAIVEKGVSVFAWRGQTQQDYYWCVNRTIDNSPDITLDDGADLVSTLHTKRTEAIAKIKGGTEETTTGVMRLRQMEKTGSLKYAIMAINDAYTKYMFDNRYGTGQSTLDGILRATNILIAGKNLVVCGYGWCGRGLANRARGMGANVIVTEVNPLRALEAIMDGFQVLPIAQAAEKGDVFVTLTGDTSIIRKEHMQKMKNGAILANSGHFNVEIKISDLESLATSKRTIRPNLDEYKLKDGRRLYILGEGRLINLAAAEGHPSEVMDMSFADQALSVEHLAKSPKMKPKVYNVPAEIDESVASLKLKAMGAEIDTLTDEQKKYLSSWEKGTI